MTVPGQDNTPSADAQPVSEPTGNWLCWAAMLIVLWAVVLFAVQEYTTGSNYPLPLFKAVSSRLVRFLLDLLACGAAVFLLGRWARYIAVMVCAIGLSVLVIYHDYFHHALTWTTITGHFDEALAVTDYAVDLIRLQSLAPIFVATAMLIVLSRVVAGRPIPRRRRVGIGAGFAVAYLLTALISTGYVDAISKLRTFGTVDRIAMTNGYLLTWYGEWRYLNADALLARAMAAAELRQDRLTPIEVALVPPDRVVVVQVESLDYDVLGVDVDGQPVMPFLCDISDRSMFYRISAIHESGSCDADFVMLMNLFPSGEVNPYGVERFDFSASLPARVAAAGYRSIFLHGNDGSFFRRAAALGGMGFDRVLFREDFESDHGLPSKHWGISDQDVLEFSARMLREDDGRVLHFVITLTSHGPFNFLEPAERELFAEPSSVRERYLNSMRYVDTQLRAYISSLPADTLVVLYGDHASHVDFGQESVAHGSEFVPLLVHRVGVDLARSQLTRGQDVAMSGELTMLDAAGYFWSLFKARGE